jgi:WD40 repeat protein
MECHEGYTAYIEYFIDPCANVLVVTTVRASAPQEPQLRIDPGMHTARIGRLGVNASCTLLATGSDDKTVRLWKLPGGKLLNTLRAPMGDGEDGKAFAVAMTPDGSLVAVGSSTGRLPSKRGGQVYIFNSSSGGITKRLEPLEFTVNHLVFSADGKYLAAALWGGLGVKVWETASWQLLAEDKDYGGESAYGAAFDRAWSFRT